MEQDNIFKSAFKFLFACLILLVGVWIGIVLHTNYSNNNYLVGNTKMDEIMQAIHHYYVDSLNEEETLDMTIHQMLSNLDPHSMYIPKKDFLSVNEPLVGNFEGIGIEFHILKDTIMVVSPIISGPSEMAGILAGDKIILINDTLVAGIGIKNETVFKYLRGKGGTKVKVSIKRAGSKDLIHFYIVRDKIPIFSVDIAYMVNAKTGYIKINSFGSRTYHEFVQKLKELKAQGMTKLIIDLRQNGGGYLDASVAIADELIPGNSLITYTEGRHFKRQSYSAEHTGLFETGELAIMIDEGSASASEILAGAVQDLDRGKIIGRRSFGKGLVMSDFMLSDSSALRLSMARYYTPSGRCVQKPYENGSLDYEAEVYNRYKHGEMFKDSATGQFDTTKYYTKNKRIVRGGGGIFPDIFVALDTSFNVKLMAEMRNQVPEFVYQHIPSLKADIARYRTAIEFKESYAIPPDLYNHFVEFCKSQKIQITEPALAKIESKVKGLMKAYIARQIYKNEAFYRIINESDPAFKKAVEAI